MFSGLVSMWLVTVLGQTPGAAADTAWLKQVPASADVVIRIRGVEPVRDDLSKMIQAMSPALANQVTPALEQGSQQILGELGKDAFDASAPILALIRLPKPGELDAKKGPPFAAFAHTKNYTAFQKAIAKGGDPQSKHQSGGYDTIKDNEGNPLYTIKGDGYAAISNDEELMKSIAKPTDTLDKTLKADLKTSLFTGDLGILVSLAAVQKQYGDHIDAARQQLMATLDAVSQQAGGEMMKPAKAMYGAMFDGLKDADALVLNFDFSAAGLTLGGDLTTKPGTETAKFFTGPKTAAGDTLAKLPADATTYLFANTSPSTIAKLQSWGIQFLTGPDEKPSPEFRRPSNSSDRPA